jgi:hypothetical protein
MGSPEVASSAKQFALALCHMYDGWVIGSSAQAVRDSEWEHDRDVDIIIPWERWNDAAQFVLRCSTGQVRPTTFGGWKAVVHGREFDVWPASLSEVASRAMFKVAYHPSTNTFLVKA